MESTTLQLTSYRFENSQSLRYSFENSSFFVFKFLKNSTISDGGTPGIKIVVLVVETFFIQNHLRAKLFNTRLRSVDKKVVSYIYSPMSVSCSGGHALSVLKVLILNIQIQTLTFLEFLDTINRDGHLITSASINGIKRFCPPWLPLE